MCDSLFPNLDLSDFINLPSEEDKAKKMIPYITWLDEVQLSLL